MPTSRYRRPRQPANSDGGGYWLTAADGGIFAFGDAPFHGSAGAAAITQPVRPPIATPTASGYRLIDATGTSTPYGTN